MYIHIYIYIYTYIHICMRAQRRGGPRSTRELCPISLLRVWVVQNFNVVVELIVGEIVDKSP